jgi:hypothetical protein
MLAAQQICKRGSLPAGKRTSVAATASPTLMAYVQAFKCDYDIAVSCTAHNTLSKKKRRAK